MNWIEDTKDYLSEVVRCVKTQVAKHVVPIAGLMVGFSVAASAEELPVKDMSVEEPFEGVAEVVVSNPSVNLENDIRCLYSEGREQLLTESLSAHGSQYMTEESTVLWTELLPMASAIPFRKVFAQYGRSSESFFFSFDFAEDRSVEAAIYVDEEDDGVYFSVLSRGETFYQSCLPKNEFFARTADIWEKLDRKSEA